MMSLSRFLLVAVLMLPRLGAADSVVVVANKSVSVTAIAPDDLREIFLGRQHSLRDGSKVTPVLLRGGPVHESFLKSYLGKSMEGFRTWWLNIVFTGQALLPKTFASEAELVDYVSRTQGAIGYVGRASAGTNVKWIQVAQ